MPAATRTNPGSRAARLALALPLALAVPFAFAGCAQTAEPAPAPAPVVTPTPEPAPEPEPEFDRAARSIDDPTSIWVVSNKLRPLQPTDYAPSDLVMPEGVINKFAHPLREEAARAFEQLVQGAAAEGLTVRMTSGYRDYNLQTALYNKYVARDGRAAADTYSARPGHSEHQTGLVVDVHGPDDQCYLDACFAQLPVGQWLAQHAAEYGFIMRYPEGYDHITGFIFEPWHYRYVGTELALEMRETGTLTLEEFFGLPAAPGYAQ